MDARISQNGREQNPRPRPQLWVTSTDQQGCQPVLLVNSSQRRIFCEQQIRRLAALTRQPTSPEGWTELIDTLDSCSRDNAHAKKIIDEWVASEHECPTPKHLRTIA